MPILLIWGHHCGLRFGAWGILRAPDLRTPSKPERPDELRPILVFARIEDTSVSQF